MAYAWHTHGIRMGYAWHTHGIRMAYAWDTHGIRMAYAWHTHGIRMAYAWSPLELKTRPRLAEARPCSSLFCPSFVTTTTRITTLITGATAGGRIVKTLLRADLRQSREARTIPPGVDAIKALSSSLLEAK